MPRQEPYAYETGRDVVGAPVPKMDSITAQAQRILEASSKLSVLAGNLRHRVRSLPEQACDANKPIEPRTVSELLYEAEQRLRSLNTELAQLDDIIGG